LAHGVINLEMNCIGHLGSLWRP